MYKKILSGALVCLCVVSCGKNDIVADSNGTGDIENSDKVLPGQPEKKITGLSVWHWGYENRFYGINKIILDESKSRETIDSYLKNSVTRVYGGYSKIPGHSAQKVNLANWNTKLHQSGIKSIYLVGNAQWIYPENRQEMLDYMMTYYVKFNLSVPSEARLKGLHLDFEPHQLKEWKTATLKRKLELLYLLKDTYRDLRSLLVQNGMESDEIIADIPTWFDEETAIGWSSESEKINWFNDAAKYLNGFTIMAYELQSIPTIIHRTSWERMNFNRIIQIGLNADEIGSIWTGKNDIIKALNGIEIQTQTPVAIHNYTTFMEN